MVSHYSTKASCRLLDGDQFQANKTETKIVNKDAKTNEKSEVENTGRSRMVGLAEQRKDIPADVYGEILSYLPVRKLQTLKIVCKDWLQLITSSDFARLHKSRGNRGHFRVLLTKARCNVGVLDYNSYYKETIQVPFPAQFPWSTTMILGSADGLIFLFEGIPYNTAVFNPSTGKCSCVQLSPPLQFESIIPKFCWFGKIGCSEECILVMGLVVGKRKEIRHVEIWVYKYSRSSNIVNRICSTQIQAGVMSKVGYPQMRGTFVQGVVHWPFVRYTDNSFHILAYDLGTNECKEISAPAGYNKYSLRLGLSVDGCSLLATSFKSIWVMKDGCWTKYTEISTPRHYWMVDPLGYLPNGDLIMEVDESQLMKYSFTRKEVTLLEDYFLIRDSLRKDDALVCADTLMSPGC